jgi:hypothetical protein
VEHRVVQNVTNKRFVTSPPPPHWHREEEEEVVVEEGLQSSHE